MNTGKLVKFYWNVFCFFNKAIRSISYNNRQILLSLGLVSMNWKCVTGAFFKNEFTASIKKMEKGPRDTQKVIFSVLFLGWKYARSKHMVLSFKSPFKHLILNVALCFVWEVSRIGTVTSSERIRSNYYYFLNVLFIMLKDQCL